MKSRGKAVHLNPHHCPRNLDPFPRSWCPSQEGCVLGVTFSSSRHGLPAEQPQQRASLIGLTKIPGQTLFGPRWVTCPSLNQSNHQDSGQVCVPRPCWVQREAIPRRTAELCYSKKGRALGRLKQQIFSLGCGKFPMAQPLVRGTWKTPLQASVSKPSLL